MKSKLRSLSDHYFEALEKFLKTEDRASFKPALKLGRVACDLGLNTMEIARVHEEALARLLVAIPGPEALKRAEQFLAKAVTPTVETLRQLTNELAATNRQLHRDVSRGKNVETALKRNEAHCNKLLEESLRLQRNLRHLTHKALESQEKERKKISHELQDEVAQILLGIHVRLIALKQEARIKTRGIQNEIASTQRLVTKSAASVRRIARNIHDKT